MKKICVFSQTYSNNRLELFNYHNKDKSDILFRNNFDLTLYSFHNCDKLYSNNLLDLDYFKNLSNLKTIFYDNISYTQSFKKTLDFLLENKFNYIIFLQDDCLSNFDMNKELIEFIKNEEFNMLNLEITPQILSVKPNIKYNKNGFEVYDTTSNDFVRDGLWAFDDGAYVANIKFLMEEIYDEIYFNKDSIWSAESYLNEKIKNKSIERLVTNIKFYHRYNILGPNCWNKSYELNELNKRFLNQ
jgi:hypothetical protein